MLHLIRELAHTVLVLFHAYEIPTLFLATLIEESGLPIPIPADTLLVLAGSQFSGKFGHALLVIGITSIAVMVGSSILFCVMQRGGRPLLVRYGRYLHLKESQLADIERWFVRYGRWGIIVARLIPGLRILATVTAGISGMSYVDYIPACAIAAVVWATVYYCLGALLGHELPLLRLIFIGFILGAPHWALALSAFLALLALLAAVSWLVYRRLHARPPTRVSAKA